MASVTTDIDIDEYIEEASDYCLLRELKSRISTMSVAQKKEFAEMLEEFEDKSDRIECVKSLDDNIKLDAFKNGFKNRTVDEVEKFFGVR